MLCIVSLLFPDDGIFLVHCRSASDGAVLSDAPLIPANDKDQDYGVEEIGKDRVECPKSGETPRVLAQFIKLPVCPRYFC